MRERGEAAGGTGGEEADGVRPGTAPSVRTAAGGGPKAGQRAGEEPDSTASARRWLAAWGACVASADTDAARPLFDPDVVGFGTRASTALGLERLVADQWSHVWPSISDFAFDVEGALVLVSDDGGQAVVAATWTSTGRRTDGTVGPRPGRATIVVRRDAAGAWRGVHTHFSLTP